MIMEVPFAIFFHFFYIFRASKGISFSVYATVGFGVKKRTAVRLASVPTVGFRLLSQTFCKIRSRQCFDKIKGEKGKHANKQGGEWFRVHQEAVLKCSASIAQQNAAKAGNKGTEWK